MVRMVTIKTFTFQGGTMKFAFMFVALFISLYTGVFFSLGFREFDYSV